MRDINILDYTTENRIGATKESTIYADHGVRESIEIPKGEVNLDDLLSGNNHYAEQMNIEYEAWKKENPDQDFSQEEYRQAVVNSGAFEYTSIKNEQQNTEFWGTIISLVIIVGIAIVSPAVGLTLGIAYGGLEIGSAASGKDWIFGRELDTQERWIRGGLGPLDIVPGVVGLKRFSGAVRTANLANAGQLGITTGLRSTIQHEMRHVGDMALTTGRQSQARLRNAGAAVRDMSRVAKNKLTRTPDAGTLAGSGAGLNINSTRRIVTESTESGTIVIHEGHINKVVSSESVNKWRADQGYSSPPYTPKTKVYDITLKEKTKIVRVYDKVNSGLAGGWVMRFEDIKGLSPTQIQEKFALPHTPEFVGEVTLEAGVLSEQEK